MSNIEGTISQDSWFTSPLTSQESSLLAATIKESVGEKIQSRIFLERDVAYIRKLPLRLMAETKAANLDIKSQNIIRDLCRSTNIEVSIISITSHRPFVGKFIVGFKKIIFPMMKALIQDILRKQNEFNYNLILANIEALRKKEQQPEKAVSSAAGKLQAVANQE